MCSSTPPTIKLSTKNVFSHWLLRPSRVPKQLALPTVRPVPVKPSLWWERRTDPSVECTLWLPMISSSCWTSTKAWSFQYHSTRSIAVSCSTFWTSEPKSNAERTLAEGCRLPILRRNMSPQSSTSWILFTRASRAELVEPREPMLNRLDRTPSWPISSSTAGKCFPKWVLSI